MNKLKHQQKLYEHPYVGPDVSMILTEEEFLSICKGEGYNNWDDNYYCIIEQQLGEVIEGEANG